ncbi:hypothetical protein FB451DRAFT_1415962 [Mycena latifolia]|nr:hypothetical protein FB451DRAFT_1415962 [Mycena latifolia]
MYHSLWKRGIRAFISLRACPSVLRVYPSFPSSARTRARPHIQSGAELVRIDGRYVPSSLFACGSALTALPPVEPRYPQNDPSVPCAPIATHPDSHSRRNMARTGRSGNTARSKTGTGACTPPLQHPRSAFLGRGCERLEHREERSAGTRIDASLRMTMRGTYASADDALCPPPAPRSPTYVPAMLFLPIFGHRLRPTSLSCPSVHARPSSSSLSATARFLRTRLSSGSYIAAYISRLTSLLEVTRPRLPAPCSFIRVLVLVSPRSSPSSSNSLAVSQMTSYA